MANQIKSFNISHMDLGSTLDFHKNTNELIIQKTPETLHIVELATRYQKAIDALSEIVNRATKYIATLSLESADDIRDRLTGVIMNVIHAHLTSPIEAMRQVAILLDAVLAPYKGIGQHKYAKQTQETDGMLRVLDETENAAAIATMHLEDEVEQLRLANENFKKAQKAKFAENKERSPLSDTDSDALKDAADAIYREIAQTVNAYAIVQPTDEINDFIADMNGMIVTYVQAMDGTSSGGSTEKPGETEPGGEDDDEDLPSVEEPEPGGEGEEEPDRPIVQ